MMPDLTNTKSDGYLINNRVTLVTGGKDYFEHILQLINRAQDTLHLQTYIFKDDKTGRMVAEAIIHAAQRGVKVFLMLDGYASQGLHRDFINELRRVGVNFKFFEPLFRSRQFYLGRRLHHKVCVVDLRFALVGGINIADHYNDLPHKPSWLDFALSVEGEIVSELFILCQKTWNGFKPLKRIPKIETAPTFNFPKGDISLVRMRRNDWVRWKDEISLSYMELFQGAKSQITILSSYFLPGRVFRKAIRNARKRGVEITVIVAGISDVKIAKMAERFMYEWLLSNGIKIYEYNRTVLHGKLAICDDEWITLGSFNVNDISTYASVELNLDVKKPEFARELRRHLEQNVINHSTLITDSYRANRTNALKRLLQWSAFATIRTLIYFFTFYFKRIVRTEVKKTDQYNI
ncbi:MAG: phospholipase D-like domain-containing protein [Cyclobacteriaceae bacterium]